MDEPIGRSLRSAAMTRGTRCQWAQSGRPHRLSGGVHIRTIGFEMRHADIGLTPCLNYVVVDALELRCCG
jgi:hypothetical protein